MADGQNKLTLSKRVSLGGDDTTLQRLASGRRKCHFQDDLIDRLSQRGPGESVMSDSGEEAVDLAGPLPNSSSSPHQMNGGVAAAAETEATARLRTTSIADYEDDVFFSEAYNASEIEKTCIVAFSTVNNIRETMGDTVKQQLRDYLEKVFKLPKSRVQVLMEMADNEESPELKLTCKVLHARSLTAKDANGKSDPYCRVGILNQAHLDTSIVKNKDLVHWKKEGLVDEVATTSIKLATLDPDWNEELELNVQDPKEDVLVLEIWDSDDEEIQQQSSKIKGLKGFGNFLTDLKKGVDDFMGRCFHPLQSIPVSGQELKTLVLHSHSTKHKHGFISVSLTIKGIKENVPVKVSIWEHTVLTRALVNESSRCGGRYTHRWDGELTPMAERLLEQHALLNGLNKLQLAAVRLSVLTKYHKLYAIRMSTLRALLQKIKEHKSFLPKTLSPEDLKRTGDKSVEWIVQLFSDLLELDTDIEEIFKNHLSIFNMKADKDLQKLEDNLIILRELYSFRPFVYQLPPERRNLKEVLEKCIRGATLVWFSIAEAKVQPTVKSATAGLEGFKELAEQCLSISKIVMKKLGLMFMEEGVSYFSHFFVTMDELLGAKVEHTLKNVVSSTETAPITFEIHTTLREISQLSQYLDKDMDTDLKLCNSHSAYKHLVEGWISVAIDRCRSRIQQAIKLNETVKGGDVRISTSAIDVCGFLLQVGEFWKHLDWPDVSVSYGLMITMLQQMCDCAQFYVRELYKYHGDQYDEEGKFHTSEELSVALNNIHHIRTVVHQLPEKLQLEEFYHWLDQGEGQGEESTLGASAKATVNRLLESADDDFDNKVRQIVDDISSKLSPDILKYISKVIAAPSDVADVDAIAPLLNYLAVNLQTLGDYTYSEVFSRVLLPIWRVCVDAVMTSMTDLKCKKGALSLPSQRLTATLDLLQQFFNADGNGIDYAEMDSNTYREVILELKVLSADSDDLTLQFFADLVEIQAEKVRSGEKQLGELLLSMEYNKEKDILNVHVIQGRSLPVMDKTGSSDPYVQLTLLPQWKFMEASKKTYKTQVEKETLDPYFNKEFQIPVKKEDMTLQGGILLLTVFDYDMITSNDFTGMCVVPLNSVPGSTSTPPSSPSQRNHTLPLFIITDDNMTQALLELGNRLKKGDSRATSFFKVNKKILGNLKKLFREGSKSSLFS